MLVKLEMNAVKPIVLYPTTASSWLVEGTWCRQGSNSPYNAIPYAAHIALDSKVNAQFASSRPVREFISVFLAYPLQ